MSRFIPLPVHLLSTVCFRLPDWWRCSAAAAWSHGRVFDRPVRRTRRGAAQVRIHLLSEYKRLVHTNLSSFNQTHVSHKQWLRTDAVKWWHNDPVCWTAHYRGVFACWHPEFWLLLSVPVLNQGSEVHQGPQDDLKLFITQQPLK